MKINVSKGCTLWIYLTSLNYTLNIAKMLYFICVLSKKKIRDNVLWDPFKFSVIPSWNIKLKKLMSCSDRSPGTILLLIRIKKTSCFSRALSRAAEAADHVCVHICVCIHIGAHTYDGCIGEDKWHKRVFNRMETTNMIRATKLELNLIYFYWLWSWWCGHHWRTQASHGDVKHAPLTW